MAYLFELILLAIAILALTVTVGYAEPLPTIHVDSIRGLDTNDGTADSPVATWCKARTLGIYSADTTAAWVGEDTPEFDIARNILSGKKDFTLTKTTREAIPGHAELPYENIYDSLLGGFELIHHYVWVIVDNNEYLERIDDYVEIY